MENMQTEKDTKPVDYLLTKEKWEITIDSMMIIGKYFESNKDFICVMKANRKYRQLT